MSGWSDTVDYELFRDPHLATVCMTNGGEEGKGSLDVADRRRDFSGVVLHLDACACLVEQRSSISGSAPQSRGAYFPPHRRTEHACGVVCKASSVARLVVYCVGDTVVQCTLCVDPRAVDRILNAPRSECLPGEEHVVGLLVQMRSDLICVTDVPHVRVDSPSVTLLPPEGLADGADLRPPVECTLQPHQLSSILWMQDVERDGSVAYSPDLPLSKEWVVDLDAECVVPRSDPRRVRLRGGVLADWTGSGKTATALTFSTRNTSPDGRPPSLCRRGGGSLGPAARGTLVVVPLHLLDHWRANAFTFVPGATVRVLASTRDLRGLTLLDVCEADVVLTTPQFVRGSKTYQATVEEAVSEMTGIDARNCRGAVAVSAYGRIVASDPSLLRTSPPVLECVHWHRILVDEMHEMGWTSRTWKWLSSLKTTYAWGITATPEVWYEGARIHYWHLCPASHPQQHHNPCLLKAVLERCIRVTRQRDDAACPALRPTLEVLTTPGADALCSRGGAADTGSSNRSSILDAVMRGTSFDATDDVEAWVPEQIAAEHRVAVDCLAAELQDHGCIDICELDALEAALHSAKAACLRVDEALSRISGTEERCPLCEDAACTVLTECAHTFCRPCVERCQGMCPICRQNVGKVRGLLLNGATKLSAIADFCVSVGEACLLYTQWKSTRRNVVAALRSRGLTPLTLDGNASQRRNVLQVLKEKSTAVLVLSLEEPFAGLHVPYVRNVVFAHTPLADREHVQRMEYQAISRVARWGQAQTVRVSTFVLGDTAEFEFWKVTHT